MPEQPLRIIFAGTPDFAATHLQRLVDSEHELVAVYTQPDRPAGRGRKLQSSPTKALALRHNIPVQQPPSLKDSAAQQTLATLNADLLVVVAYGLILPQAVLDTPGLGCLNVHASLLPRWRGAAPIQRAIEAGDRSTGITIMQMDAGLDTGAMLARASCEIGAHMTAAHLHDTLAKLGPDLLLKVLADIHTYRSNGQPQDDSLATYAHKITKSEAVIDWRQSALEIDRRVRAFNPFPICYSLLGRERIRVWQARPAATATNNEGIGTIIGADENGIVVNCGEGALALEVLQLEGGKPLPVKQLLTAHQARFAMGECFELPAATGTA
jgi:methionyl-tRNA formyltransferase